MINDPPDDHPVYFAGYHDANIVLIDSYITTPYDISYSGNFCHIIKNERLSNDIQYISRLHLNCYKSDGDYLDIEPLNKSMDAIITSTTNHLSPVH